VCLRDDDVLLVRRGNPPRRGEWAIPGGRIEWAETARAAALRELAEETGIDAELGPLIDVVDGIFRSRTDGTVWGHYVLVDFAARWRSGEPRAGDDAAEARFFTPSELGDLDLWSETRRVIDLARARLGS
jgi:8-oxo-dGTP diphosphatase